MKSSFSSQWVLFLQSQGKGTGCKWFRCAPCNILQIVSKQSYLVYNDRRGGGSSRCWNTWHAKSRLLPLNIIRAGATFDLSCVVLERSVCELHFGRCPFEGEGSASAGDLHSPLYPGWAGWTRPGLVTKIICVHFLGQCDYALCVWLPDPLSITPKDPRQRVGT